MSLKEIRTWKKVALNDIEYLANEVKDLLVPLAIIIFTGEVGSGKTTLAKSFIHSEKITMGSPSYSLLHEYGSILHGDFYRIKDPSEIYSLELSLYMEGKSHFIVEWGKEYINPLINEIGFNAQYYELIITPAEDSKFRNYELIQLDPHE